jgi:hypothetical protein
LDEETLKLIKRLTERLERLSADSTYAHKASGLRGMLLRAMEGIESGHGGVNNKELGELVEYGFEILEKAAKEMRVPK